VTRIKRHAYLLLTLVIVGLGCVCLLNGSRRIGKSFPGFLLSGGRIVVSISRFAWLAEGSERILLAQLVAVEGRPVDRPEEVDAAIARLLPGTPVTYRFHKQSEVFNLQFEVRRFSLEDFVALHATYFGVGLCFAFAAWYVTRRPRPWPSATLPFFVLSQFVATVVFLACDAYGPHWFTALYILVHCLTPAAVWHFAITYPDYLLSDWSRRMSVFALYAICGALAWLVNLVWDDPSRLLPLIYTTYLLLANAILIYIGRLTIAWRTIEEPARGGVRLAWLGSVLSAAVPLAIFVFYPAMERTVPPFLLVGPLLFFPALVTAAVCKLDERASRLGHSSIRRHLSLLFLGAVETAYIAGVGVFWMSSTWEQLLAELQLNHRQQLLVAELRDSAGFPASKLEVIEAAAQSDSETDLLAAVRIALGRGDPEAAGAMLGDLFDLYKGSERSLAGRLMSLGSVDEVFFVLLILLGTVQATAFMLAVRHWLMQPVAQLTTATAVIATGDLTHRVAVSSSEEFTALGNAINTMAESLSAIQVRIEGEREARHLAAASARDAERQRLGRELHDSVLQDLSAIKLTLETMHREAAGRSPATALPLVPVVDALIAVIVGLRRVVDDIAAPDLAQDSVAHAILSYCQMATMGHGVQLVIDLDHRAFVAAWATRDVYRIAQEAITNALRHARPSRLRVALRSDEQGAVLEVEDNGCGFAVDKVTLGAGVAGMRERATAIGAHLDFLAVPGRGTLVRLQVPRAGLPREAGSVSRLVANSITR